MSDTGTQRAEALGDHQIWCHNARFRESAVTAVERLRSRLLNAADETLDFNLRAYVPAIANPV